jgi:hypothetical protein
MRAALAIYAVVLRLCTPAFAVASSSDPTRVAVMPFGALPVGMNDELLAQPAELKTLRGALVSALDANRAFRAVPIGPACDLDPDHTCALGAARRAGAPILLTSGVTRYMGLLWSVTFEAIDTRNGRDLGPWSDEYKGDFESLVHAMPEMAARIEHVVNADVRPKT